MLLQALEILMPFLLLVGYCAGIFFCFRLRFMPGALFFFILIVNKILQFYFQNYISHYDTQQTALPQDMSVGELVSAFQIVSHVIEIIAFVILLIGLYQKWSKRKHPSLKVEELRPRK